MNHGFHRLHALRMENDAAGYAMEEMRGRFQRMQDRRENGSAPRAVSSFNLFQTPPALAKRMAALLRVGTHARILEPSAGLGRLLDAALPLAPAEVVAVEMASNLCAELYLQERPGVILKQGDFLAMDGLGLFDGVIMNPPFHMRADIAHIEHALKFLKPGGVLVALCMDTTHREEALKSKAATWEHIPAGTFQSEGTKIASVLLTIRNP